MRRRPRRHTDFIIPLNENLHKNIYIVNNGLKGDEQVKKKINAERKLKSRNTMKINQINKPEKALDHNTAMSGELKIGYCKPDNIDSNKKNKENTDKNRNKEILQQTKKRKNRDAENKRKKRKSDTIESRSCRLGLNLAYKRERKAKSTDHLFMDRNSAGDIIFAKILEDVKKTVFNNLQEKLGAQYLDEVVRCL
jgi:hypothetical protein